MNLRLEEPTIYTNINIHSRIYLISLKTKINILYLLQRQMFIKMECVGV